MNITVEPIMGRERRRKGTPTHQLHAPVALATDQTFKDLAKAKGVSVGLLLDEIAQALSPVREQVIHSGTANSHNASDLA
jgi:hypothetical protein